ncbi:iron complex outermembrane receptor protein [Novosphingobium hassiacum]|uniref:Iron complex outermembrane receptor protein n=1 Tax=Novosphingobium hassiacum TaxID=173676 RepID=A0A7W6A0P0_9SPHN|nr:TonB-dependent receptor [Novosphingobium hassiacum]MBB3862659.1 iron complex outermembrane receptor protein [Novosphingobium hassiacum]
MSKMQSGASLVALACATMISSLWTDVARAQSTDEGIADIVVTARKRAESLQNVPIAVTALDSVALKNQSVQSVKDVQYQTPSLVIAPTNADRNSLTVSIRGQSVADTLLTVDPAIGIYIDGVNFAKTVGTELASLVDVERVEVLKGPQGTLFGRNTTGGALSITTKMPTYTFGGELIGRTDYYGRAGGSIVLNLPISDDVLALRLVGSYDRRDSFGKNRIDGLGIGGDLDGGSIRGTLLWNASDAIEVVLRGDYNKTSTSAQAFKARELFIAAPGSRAAAGAILADRGATTLAGARLAYIADGNTDKFWDANQNVTPSHSRVKSYGGSGTITVDLGDSTQLKSITSYRRLTRDTLMDMDGSRYNLLEVNGLTSQKLFAQEGQLTGKLLDESVDWIIGGFYSHETGNDGTRTFALKSLGLPRNVVDGDVINKSIAGFGQFTWRFVDKLSFTGGLRYTKDTKSLISRNRALSTPITCQVPSPDTPGVCQRTFKDSWDDMSYTAVLDYQPRDGLLLYAKTSRGFRSGGFNLRGSIDPQTFLPFEPENVTDYEVGLKADLLDRHLRLNLAGYRSSYKDIQRSVVVPSGNGSGISTVIQNAASARINGLEAEITAKPTQALTLRATGAMTDAKYSRYVNGLGADLSGLKFPFTPKWTYTLSAGYDFPLDNGPLHIQADWGWQDDIYFFPDSLFNGTNGLPDLRGQKAYGLLNGRISKSFEKERFEVAFFVRNALNKKYYAAGLDTGSSLGFSSGIPGDPRLVGAEASIKF